MEGTQLASPSEAATLPMPVMDVVAPPAENKSEPAELTPVQGQSPASTAPRAHQNAAASSPKPTNLPAVPKSGGAAGAIFAAVVIVLGLAALAVYAYLKQPR